MRTSWVQIAEEIANTYAQDVGSRTQRRELTPGERRHCALGGIVDFVFWAVRRSPKHCPPSAVSAVIGEAAAELIADGARYEGEPQRLVDAYCAVGMLEALPNGFRLKGLDRYDRYWEKSYPAEARKWRAEHPEWKPARSRRTSVPGKGTIPAPFGAGKRRETPPLDQDQDLDPEGDDVFDVVGDPDSNQHPPPTPSAPVAEPAPDNDTLLDGERPPDVTDADLAKGWRQLQETRARLGFARELLKPAGLRDFLSRQRADGYSFQEVLDAYERYLPDKDFSVKGSPTALFITGDIARVRMRVPPSPPRRRAFW